MTRTIWVRGAMFALVSIAAVAGDLVSSATAPDAQRPQLLTDLQQRILAR